MGSRVEWVGRERGVVMGVWNDRRGCACSRHRGRHYMRVRIGSRRTRRRGVCNKGGRKEEDLDATLRGAGQDVGGRGDGQEYKTWTTGRESTGVRRAGESAGISVRMMNE